MVKSKKKGNFCTWPVFTTGSIRNYFKETITSAKGHMRQTKNNVLSTKITPPMNDSLNYNNQTYEDTRQTSEKQMRNMLK